MKRHLRIENHHEDLDRPTIYNFNLNFDDDYKSIVEWYGAFASGDPIKVFVNGIEKDLDLNHRIAQPIIGGGVHHI